MPVAIADMNVEFNGVKYAVYGTVFNVSLGTMTNPDNVTDSTQHTITIENNTYIGYSNQLEITPALTAQNLNSMVSLSVPSNNTINE